MSVNFASADGTATAGADYTALTPGTLNFAPGETSKTITVDVLGDIAVEPSETFSVVLSEGVNAVIDDATAIGTILDDDVTLRGKRMATFTDVDGDLVTIKVSKGTLKVEDFTIVPSGQGAQLALVDFSGETEFAGANLSITAKRAPEAPPLAFVLVDVGYINASGIDLGKVVIKGDLGQIDAGNDLDPRPGLLSLSANSLGQRGTRHAASRRLVAERNRRRIQDAQTRRRHARRGALGERRHRRHRDQRRRARQRDPQRWEDRRDQDQRRSGGQCDERRDDQRAGPSRSQFQRQSTRDRQPFDRRLRRATRKSSPATTAPAPRRMQTPASAR